MESRIDAADVAGTSGIDPEKVKRLKRKFLIELLVLAPPLGFFIFVQFFILWNAFFSPVRIHTCKVLRKDYPHGENR